MINYEKLREEFKHLPKDYAKLIQKKYPNLSSARINNIKNLPNNIDEATYKPSSKTVDIFVMLLEISKKHKEQINLLK